MNFLKVVIALICFLIIGIGTTKANHQKENIIYILKDGNNLFVVDNPVQPKLKLRLVNFLHSNIDQKDQRKVKITASVLALTLGPFGVHRLYLGTSPLIPVVYVATVGGGVGILPFIDFVAIVFSKDLTPYMNNNQIFMWVKK